MGERMEFSQSETDNRKAFIDRLVVNGWKRSEAVKEWTRLQAEDAESDGE